MCERIPAQTARPGRRRATRSRRPACHRSAAGASSRPSAGRRRRARRQGRSRCRRARASSFPTRDASAGPCGAVRSRAPASTAVSSTGSARPLSLSEDVGFAAPGQPGAAPTRSLLEDAGYLADRARIPPERAVNTATVATVITASTTAYSAIVCPSSRAKRARIFISTCNSPPSGCTGHSPHSSPPGAPRPIPRTGVRRRLHPFRDAVAGRTRATPRPEPGRR